MPRNWVDEVNTAWVEGPLVAIVWARDIFAGTTKRTWGKNMRWGYRIDLKRNDGLDWAYDANVVRRKEKITVFWICYSKVFWYEIVESKVIWYNLYASYFMKLLFLLIHAFKYMFEHNHKMYDITLEW